MKKENVIQKTQKLLKLQYGAESIGSTGEAAEGETLNITGKENNPLVSQLVEAIENQE